MGSAPRSARIHGGMTTPSISPQQVREIAAAAVASEKTVRRIYRGMPSKPATIERLRRAAKVLGLQPPPEPEFAAPLGEKCPCGVGLVDGDHATGRCEGCYLKGAQ